MEIERHGLSQLTVRAVAAAADMNIAAVNYLFRSKQALVAAALESSIVHMLEDTESILMRLPQDPETVLGELLAYYLEGCRPAVSVLRRAGHAAGSRSGWRATRSPTPRLPVVPAPIGAPRAGASEALATIQLWQAQRRAYPEAEESA